MNHGIHNAFLYTTSLIVNHSLLEGGEKVSVGTGFWIANSKKEICLVTNKHVLRKEKDSDILCDFFDIYNWEISDNNQEKRPTGYFVYRVKAFTPVFPKNDLDDIVCIKWPFEVESVSDSRKKNMTVFYVLPYCLLATQDDFDKRLFVCDKLASIGYPTPFNDLKYPTPILRSGIISSDPRFNLMNGKKGNCLAYETFSWGGSSGSPVFALQKGFQPGDGLVTSDNFYRELKLIGINAGYCPVDLETKIKQNPELTLLGKQHSGISLLYKSTSIIETIDS